MSQTTPDIPDLSHQTSTVAISCELKELRPSGGKALSEDDRRAMLKAARQGDVVELTAVAVVYSQSKSPRPLPVAAKAEANANFDIAAPEALAALAASFTGQPFLADHSLSMDKVGGLITMSELVETDDRFEIHQSLKITAQWAVIAALDGTLRWFSVCWEAINRRDPNTVMCSVCGDSLWQSDCTHFPGDEISFELPEGKQKLLVEGVWNGIRGRETSAVVIPAVQSTRIESIRSALAAGRQPNEDQAMADKDQAKELAALKERLAALEVEQAAGAELLATAETALAKVRADHKAEADRVTATRLAAAREGAIAKGLMVDGDKRAILFDKLGKLSVEQAEEFVTSLGDTAVVPVGGKMQSDRANDIGDASSTDPLTAQLRDENPDISDLEIAEMRRVINSGKLGQDMEAFLKFNKEGPSTNYVPTQDQE